MKLKIIAVGKLKEKHWTEAVHEYTKRLQKYTSVTIIQPADEKTPEHAGPALEERVKKKEGEGILKAVQEGDRVILLAIDGRKMDSIAFAGLIEDAMLQGTHTLAFVIGGSLGVSREVYDRADFLLSFSDMTFPHQLMRVILLEQIYRAFKIVKREPYHK